MPAQSQVVFTTLNGNNAIPVSPDNPLPVTAIIPDATEVKVLGSDDVSLLEVNIDGSINVNAIITPNDDLVKTVVSFAAAGDNPIVAGVAAQTVKIYSLILVIDAPTILTFKSGAGTNLTGPMKFLAAGSMVLDPSERPWFKTAIAEGFVINSTNAVQISGNIGSITT